MASGDFTPLRPKQRKYLEGRAQGMTKEQAKRFAQYADSTSTASIESPSVKAAFARIVRRAASARKLALRIAEGVDATETKFFEHEGVVTASRDVIAWGERRKYIRLAAEYGQYAEPNNSGVNTQLGPVPQIVPPTCRHCAPRPETIGLSTSDDTTGSIGKIR